MILFLCCTLGRKIFTIHLERGCWPRAYRIRGEAYGVGLSINLLTDVPPSSERVAS